MERRSTRSRSKTPLVAGESEMGRIHKDDRVVETEVSMKAVRRSARHSRRVQYITSDYSSEDGEADVPCTFTENRRNHQLEASEQRQLATKANGDEFLALRLYREAKQYWNLYPKTDYTYSPNSKDRVEIAPGIVNMPNMSRKSIHGVEMVHKETNTVKPRVLFASNNNHYSLSKMLRSVHISFVTKTLLVVHSVLWLLSTPLDTLNSVVLKTMRMLHRLASQLLMLDTWMLQARGEQQQQRSRDGERQETGNKMRALCALCLLPLLILGGMWLLSALGHAVNELSPTSLPFFIVQNASVADEQLPAGEESSKNLNTKEHYAILSSDLITKEQVQEMLNADVNLIVNDHAQRMEQLQLQLDELRADVDATRLQNAETHAQLAVSAKRCCRFNLLQLQRHVNAMMSAILNSDEHKANMSKWLATVFVAHHELEAKLNAVASNVDARFDDLVSESARRLMDEIGAQLAGRVTHIPPNEQQIRDIVQDVIAVYDADKTGLVDYALESGGGQILSTRCTEQYNARTSVMSIFGVPLWYHTTGPRAVITPGVMPGECWAFQNFPGFIVVKLSHNVTIQAVSYEHVSRLLTPTGRLDSAPKDMQVFGLRSEVDREPILLGEYKYDALGNELQFFRIASDPTRSFQIVELKVNSNHGNPNYTCLYRFRVHGQLAT